MLTSSNYNKGRLKVRKPRVAIQFVFAFVFIFTFVFVFTFVFASLFFFFTFRNLNGRMRVHAHAANMRCEIIVLACVLILNELNISDIHKPSENDSLVANLNDNNIIVMITDDDRIHEILELSCSVPH